MQVEISYFRFFFFELGRKGPSLGQRNGSKKFTKAFVIPFGDLA